MRQFFIPATLAAVLSVGPFALQPAEARGTDWQGGGGGQAVQPMDQQTAMVTVKVVASVIGVVTVVSAS